MEYYELFQSNKVENCMEIMGLNTEIYTYAMTEKDFSKLDQLKVAYYSGREFEEICDIVLSPTFLISDKLKRLFELYDQGIKFKGIQVFPTTRKSNSYPLYWVPQLRKINCMHSTAVIMDNGMVKELVLDEKKIGDSSIFRISGLLEYKVIVTLPVAESILRRRLYGVELRRVEVK